MPIISPPSCCIVSIKPSISSKLEYRRFSTSKNLLALSECVFTVSRIRFAASISAPHAAESGEVGSVVIQKTGIRLDWKR